MPKPTNQSARRAPRFIASPTPTFHLPARVSPPSSVAAKPGFHTYYVSATRRDLTPYQQSAEKHFHQGFRGALLAPAGLKDNPPGFTILGVQDGDVFEHARGWAWNSPLDELHAVFTARKTPVTLKDKEKAQQRFAEAVATLEALELEKLDAERELEAATLHVIDLQGPESMWIEGIYYDASYSREKVYLRKRDPRFNPADEQPPVTATPEPKKRAKKAKRSRRAA